MKKFLLLVTVFILVLLFSFYKICLRANGFTDPLYVRFTTPQQTSLILGTSRAAQGLQPQVFNETLERRDMFNYAFTLGHSPFGKTYYESIQRKLKSDTKNGIFVINIDPWSLSSDLPNPNDSLNFAEQNLSLANQFVNMNPNFLYLIRYYDQPLKTLLEEQKPTNMFLHNNGWLQVDVPMHEGAIMARLQNKIRDYRDNNLPKFKFSDVRFYYLAKTIEFLQQHGDVYLVRLPVHPLMLELDNKLVPDLNQKVEKLCQKHHVQYMNFESEADKYLYTDGNHLWQESGTLISYKIATWIKQDQQKKGR